MKKIFQTIFALGVFAGGCSRFKKARMIDFIPGIYVRPIHHEFADGQDTLVITSMESGDNSYKIVKRSAFVQYANGKTLPLKHNENTWIGIFDSNTGIIHEQRHGKVISFDREQHCLFVGGSKYQKVGDE